MKERNDMFTDRVDFRQYRRIENSMSYEDDGAHLVSRKTKKISVYINKKAYGGRILSPFSTYEKFRR